MRCEKEGKIKDIFSKEKTGVFHRLIIIIIIYMYLEITIYKQINKNSLYYHIYYK